jgi:hypothetical protein
MMKVGLEVGAVFTPSRFADRAPQWAPRYFDTPDTARR